MNSKWRVSLANIFAKLRYLFVKFFKFIKENFPLSNLTWKWLKIGSIVSMAVFTIGYMIFFSDTLTLPWIIFTSIMIGSLPLLFGGLARLGILIVGWLPKKASWLIYAAGSLVLVFSAAPFKGVVVQLFFFLFSFLFLFGAGNNLRKPNWEKLNKARKSLNLFFFIIAVLALSFTIWFLAYPGPQNEDKKNFPLECEHLPEQISLPDPSEAGPYKIVAFTYGSGEDKHRSEFSEGISHKSRSVDGSNFIDGWDKLTGKIRTAYWGFGVDSLPINGRGWMPEGEGLYPVILMVHGNHLDRDFSDEGYAYLGKNFASHGVVAISVDENFVNSGMTNFSHPLSEENDARGWLLLKHLELLREWTQDSTSSFFQNLDLNNVILIGHSRGGEAVCVAAAFNKLSCYPDNAEEIFDFNFGIKGLVALAQVDGQYAPSGYPTKLKDVNYLGLQGSLDADLDSYMGMKQFNRTSFSDSTRFFKAGVFIQGANHGQFNSTWGKYDMSYPNNLFINRRAMIDAESQQKIAKVYLNAFQKVAFGTELAYKSLFEDYRTGRDWLPEVTLVNQFQSSNETIFANFEEDIDIRTSKDSSVSIEFNNLASLYETQVGLRKGKAHTKAVYIAWNNSEDSIPGTYVFRFENPPNIQDYRKMKFVFDIGLVDKVPGKRMGRETEAAEEIEEVDSDETVDAEGGELETDELEKDEEKSDKESDEKKEAIGFEIMLKDVDGDSATISLLDYFPLNPIEIPKPYKLDYFFDAISAELVQQHVSIDLELFFLENMNLKMDSLASIAFVFSHGEKGFVAIDNVGFSPDTN